MYSIEEIKELIATLDNSGLTNLEIVDQKGERLTLKKRHSSDFRKNDSDRSATLRSVFLIKEKEITWKNKEKTS